jgi:hypothetical protein
MSSTRDSDKPAEATDLELAAHIFVWDEDEDVARGMIEIEKLEAEHTPVEDAAALDRMEP